MSNILEYILKLNDGMSAKLGAVGIKSDDTKRKLMSLQKQSSSTFSGMRNILGAAGIGFGMFQIVSAAQKGIEKVHALHMAEAQLKNTMMNMGTYSAESFDKIVAGSKKMASGILYSTADIVGLQSQLRMVGGIGESEMQRMTTASADMATKLGMGIDEAGNALAKAVNNPEMMTRLAMRIKIDPAAVKHMQDLAKGGNEAAARLELLNIVEQKVGGAAKAAFDADPLSRFNKTISGMQMAIGDAAIEIQVALGPALETLAGNVKYFAVEIGKLVKWMVDNQEKVLGFAAAYTVMSIAINAVAIKTKLALYWEGLMLIKTNLATAAFVIQYGALVAWQWATNLAASAQWLLNIAMDANPIGAIVIGIMALVALIYVVIKKYNDWGAALTVVMGPLGLIINMIMSFKRNWDSIVKAFKDDGIIGGIKRIGIVLLDAILYPVQQLLQILSHIPGLGKLAGGGADKIQEIREKLGLAKPIESISTGKNFNTGPNPFAPALTGYEKFQIAPAKVPGQNDASGDQPTDPKAKATNDAISSGGTRNTAIHINFKNMVESIVFDGNLADKRDDLEKEVTSIMARVLGMAQATS